MVVAAVVVVVLVVRVRLGCCWLFAPALAERNECRVHRCCCWLSRLIMQPRLRRTLLALHTCTLFCRLLLLLLMLLLLVLLLPRL